MLIRSVTLPSREMLGGCGVLRMAAAPAEVDGSIEGWVARGVTCT